MKYRALLNILISYVLLFPAGVTNLSADTISRPVSVAIPTGINGEMDSKPVSIAIPEGMYGNMSTKPVTVAYDASTPDGVYMGKPATVAFKPENQGDPDLVGLWHMDGDWGDASGNNLHGVPYNGVAFNSNCKAGSYAGSFDGVDDYVDVASSSILRPAQLTLAAWVMPQTSGIYKTIVLSEPIPSSSQVGYGFRQRTNNKFWFTLGKEGQGVATVESQTTLVPGNWYYLVGTYTTEAKSNYM